MAKRERHPDLFTIHVGTGGIGRMGFMAWTEEEEIDRSDGDDLQVYDTPGQALAALAKRLDDDMLHTAWCDRMHLLRTGKQRKVTRLVERKR